MRPSPTAPKRRASIHVESKDTNSMRPAKGAAPAKEGKAPLNSKTSNHGAPMESIGRRPQHGRQKQGNDGRNEYGLTEVKGYNDA